MAQTAVAVDPKTHAKVKAYAKANGMTVKGVIMAAVLAYIRAAQEAKG